MLVPSWEPFFACAVKGECVGAMLLEPLVLIFCCLSLLALMHVDVAWTIRARVVLSHEREGL
jgi:hypothetical protein